MRSMVIAESGSEKGMQTAADADFQEQRMLFLSMVSVAAKTLFQNSRARYA